jgi:nucleotide-binding universal stress UspA family protein
MKSIRRIVYATDLSPVSEPAWAQAQRLGRLFDADVLAVHVLPPLPLLPAEGYVPPRVYEELLDGAHREAQARLDALLRDAGSTVRLKVRLESGPPASRLLEVVTEEAADLLVVGTHGRAGLERLVLGSVADRMVRQAPCPVLTVRPAPESGARGPIRRICYATDFSPTARAAWAWVVAIASAADAAVDLVHVPFEPVADRHLPAESIQAMARLFQDQGRMQAEQLLERSPLPRERVHVRLSPGVPGDRIVRYAREHAADLIVMGTHGWSGIVRWMLGSVAHYVIQTAPCPVLTVGPAGAAGPERAGGTAEGSGAAR